MRLNKHKYLKIIKVKRQKQGLIYKTNKLGFSLILDKYLLKYWL